MVPHPGQALPCGAGRAPWAGSGGPSQSFMLCDDARGGAAESGSINPGEEAWLSPRAHVQVGGNPASAPGPKGRPLVVLLVALTSPKGDFGVRAGS